MAWTPYQIFLAVMMVVTGSINTLATKWADGTVSRGKYGQLHPFDHPFLQAVSMFIGELSCLLMFRIIYFYYKRKDYTEDMLPPSVAGSRTFNPLIFLLPAMCDMTATSTMYVGLNLTYASSFQMLRGALIIFTGLLSVAFLNRKLKVYEWVGIFFVIAGLIVVGLSDMLSKSTEYKDSNSLITGDLLIIMAQIVTAAQMVIEEKFIVGKNIAPLQAVGWEGFFGFVVLTLLLIPMYFINVGNMIFKNPDGQIEDAIDGLYQIKNNWQTATGVMGTMVSIAFFNFSGISVTKQISATTRTVLDSVRTLVIWAFSLIVGWQDFSYIQLVGFIILLIGMFLYNDVLIRPGLIRLGVFVEQEAHEETEVIREPEDSREDRNSQVTA